MKKTDSQNHKLRTFIAIPIENNTAREIFNQSATIKYHFGNTDWRWLPPDKWHLTIAFLDELTPHKIEQCYAQLLNHIKTLTPFNLTLVAASGFPKHKPRCIAMIPQNSSPLLQLQKIITTSCKTCGIIPEKRKFYPHITLARHKHKLPLTKSINDYLLLPPIGLTVNKLFIYRSQLSRQGSIYSKLKTLSLNDTE